MRGLSQQLAESQYLLIERVVDALICFFRARKLTVSEFPTCVYLDSLPGRKRLRLGKFPWRVVMAVSNPLAIKQLFANQSMREWLCIGVDVIPARRIAARPDHEPPEDFSSSSPSLVPQGRCTQGQDGLEGTVGGVLRSSLGQSSGVTCRHVLSSTCGSLRWPSFPVRPANNEFTQQSPDAAFINLGSGCFDRPSVHAVSVWVANQSRIERAVMESAKLVKTPRNSAVRGVVKTAYVSGFRLGSYFYRGPHIEIAPYFFRKLGIIWPISRRFSRPGDSGCWVIDNATGAWIGMVIGGYESPHIGTMAIAAHFVTDAYRRLSNSPGSPVAESFE